MILVALVILASLTAGYGLYSRFGSRGADPAYDTLAFVSASFWLLAGLFLVMGGFVVPGAIVLIIFSYVWLAKGIKTKDRLRAVIAG